MADNGTQPLRPPYASVHDFRQRRYREITLPSGLLVQIRVIQSFDLLSVWDLPLPSSGRERGDEDAAEHNADTIRRGLAWRDAAILHGCVCPPIAPRGEGSEEALGLDELSNADYEALSQAILQHSGLAPEVAATVEAFRQDAERQESGADRGEVPRAAASGAADDASGVLPQPAAGDAGPERDRAASVTPPASADGGPPESVGAV